ncbi:tRNA pseudouridine(38-40) synthase TruA [uncultured Arcobacter sp.]|uniref:tRNA pseudouridine(38-40) synthase TruA n=1 Tax=uncultured Arcobacter sp. TaxID=165434 RepID=UPI0026260A31|nr:tRNA pseudouridine(38-40) synthase TruA [uncultured Arcobacter sp.]
MNVKITISYDGFSYQGSQRQPNKKSVENKLIEVFNLLNIEPKIILSGRTDKQVHATGQVFNINIPIFWSDLKKLKKVLNHKLPTSIRIKNIKKVSDEFHSRFHAKKRVYRYVVSTKEITPFLANYVTFVKSINEQKIKEAIQLFNGLHDFEYFHKLGSDKENLVREVYDTKFYKYKDFYIFKFEANSYLRSQIRLMVGFLLKISDGKLSKDDLKNQLEKKKITNKIPAPANGLYLAKVKYFF